MDGLVADEAGHELEVPPVADEVAGVLDGGRASGVRVPASPGPIPTTASSPRGEPIEDASSGAGARAMAQVPRTDLVFSTTSSPSGPAAARAAPSATPWQPTAWNTRSEGFRSRGASASRTGAGRNRAGTPRESARAWTAVSSDLRSIENTPATASGASPAASRHERARVAISSGAAPRSQPMPTASRRGR